MPDANGNFKGIRVPAAAWQRVFAGPAQAGDTVRVEDQLSEFADYTGTVIWRDDVHVFVDLDDPLAPAGELWDFADSQLTVLKRDRDNPTREA